MVALNFNANEHKPSYGGDTGLPDGTYKTVIVHTDKINVERIGQVVGAYLEIKHVVIEGPLKDQTMIDRLNLQHSNPETVRIANQQLSAYCHVLGTFGFSDTRELHNKPMQIEVGRQIDKNTKQPMAFGEIKKIFDQNGNAPGKTGGNGGQHSYQQQPNAGDPPPAGVHAQGGGWNGGGQPQQGGQGQNGSWGGNSGGYDQGQNQGSGGGQGGFQPNNGGGGANQSQAGGFNASGNAGGGGGNWGGAAGGQQQGQNGGGFDQGQQQQSQGQGQSGGGNWQPQQGGNGGGQPSWGQR